jgi:hypothetical protein
LQVFLSGHDLIFELKKRFGETSNIYDVSAFTALRVRFTAGPVEPGAGGIFPPPPRFHADQLTLFQTFRIFHHTITCPSEFSDLPLALI